MYHWEAGEYGLVPEVFTFADWTPIKAVATSTEMNESSTGQEWQQLDINSI